MAWGTNKFTKKLLRPNAVNNNELADFISRVPDNEELVGQLVIVSITLVIIFSFLEKLQRTPQFRRACQKSHFEEKTFNR